VKKGFDKTLPWRNLKAGVDTAWASMESALERASAKFKK
jgi:hypothetical protein